VLARMLRGGQDPATAVAGARLSLVAPAAGPFRLWWGDLKICVEGHAPAAWSDGLTSRGHDVIPISAFEPNAVGGCQAIEVVRPGDGSAFHFVGAADPRSPCAGTASR
jgi:hypothetical protein